MRKQPRQQRSIATVEAIIEAGAHILSELGWAGFNTNKVAEAAGVSIGSLYQYFPDKLALVEAIRRRHFDNVLSVISEAAADEKPLRQFARKLVRGMIAAHSIHPTLHQVLLDEAPGDRGSRAAHAAFQSRYLEHYAAAVAQYRRRRKDHETVARVLSSAVEGVIHNEARRGILDAPGLQKQLVELVCAYLSGGKVA
ncbi:TetR/AcrR family transcriptional regulator [Mesorhizobium sp. M9A.F.Ca.ET.002.03.1.2]|uniref:TetR/AcrR family transcriptional regulator n=1 Tax=Mesorhizobium sp. M9A.F.Ca.ET.002.03.1.2 TaxID=2493668 RepID=UPI000F75F6CE|nr:TetR/AcrR family transcriptional regulator [Mesorhizobium sp. M9A.F.Ca.ET.002.03.1.2]AZO01469.1 TetR/AcrR family transcriptional regulator [Mesorhizobium sp. M9A.F.Ca.ET.002.03.1.2]